MKWNTSLCNFYMGLLPDTQNCGLCMRRQCRERFPRHRGLAIQTCITARAWRTGHDAWRDRYLKFTFEVGGVENFPGIPAACATRNFAYLVRGPWRQYGQFLHINKTNMRVLLVPSLVSHTIGSSWYHKICKSHNSYIFLHQRIIFYYEIGSTTFLSMFWHAMV